ncbi:MAG: hypothetical protein ACXVZV_08150 [Terriglobales bacterium]
MSENPTREALEELLDYLEQVETRTEALVLLLKDKGIITSDEEFKPYLDQASTPTDVISRAIHARFDALFNPEEAVAATEAVPGASASNENVAQAAAQKPIQNKPEGSSPAKERAA